ncbi:MAG: response regulator [Planctomycetota bacterium]
MKLLLVDDDELLRERLARALTKRGYDVREAEGPAAALRLAQEDPPDLAVIDLKMPGGTGIEVVRELKRIAPDARSVILTGYGSIANTVDAMHAGAVGYVTKPADADQVLEAFRRAAVDAGDGSGEDELSDPPAPTQIQTPSLAEAEWNHIQQVLADCGGNITRAAEHLGIPRRTLQRKLKKLAP